MPRRFGTSKDRKTMYFSLVSPLDPNSHTKYKPYLHMKNHRDRLFAIDLEPAQNSLEFFQTANGSVLCNGTVPSEFLTETINLKRRIRKVRKRTIQRRRVVSYKKESMRAEIIKENKSSEVHVQCN